MAVEGWLQHGTEALWQTVDGPPPFPRNLSRLMRDGVAVRPVGIPNLTLEMVAQQLQRFQLPATPVDRDRPLRGCLVVSQNRRFVFFDTRDPDEERRFTLAHEIAHLWLEVLEPRERVRAFLGEAALEVLDGLRDPHPAERAQALLHRVPLHRPFHLLERDTEWGIVRAGIHTAEVRADRLALELLAPEEAALRVLPEPLPSFADWLQRATRRLGDEFGLPPGIARDLARSLGRSIGVEPTFWERLNGT